jgi:hypothetical protein
MDPKTDFTILFLHQLEKLSIVEIYEYFNGSISKEYIIVLINNADNNEEYFDEILLNYLVC